MCCGQWELHWLLGKAYEASGDFRRSAEHFGIAFTIANEHKDVVHEYIMALLRVKDLDRARSVITSLAILDEPSLRFDAALVRYVSGEFDKAIQLIDECHWPDRFTERIRELRARVQRHSTQ